MSDHVIRIRFVAAIGLILQIAVSWLGLQSCLAGLQSDRISLNGQWMVTSDDRTDPTPVTVPSTLEDAWQVEYDGKSVWHRNVPSIEIPDNRRLILHFEAVATQATVWIGDQRVGEHLGGWTPFEFDITDFAIAHAGEESWDLRVEVDELVGHNTQGFLPIITHHFGGIWQPVWMEMVPASRIAETSVMVRGNQEEGSMQLHVPVWPRGTDGEGISLRVSVRPVTAGTGNQDGEWVPLGSVETAKSFGGDSMVFAESLKMADAIAWSPENPQLYDARLELVSKNEAGERVLDTCESRFGFSRCSNDGKKLLWNGRPLVIRGVLNWGYAPPRVAPSLDEQWMRDEIRFAQERGFNLMKFCLWIPPKRYLELCDELGMLAWIEYPTWHPRLDAQHQSDLFREYSEFFAYDRNHPSVALRSLTCETGPSADLEVIRGLYEFGKEMIPAAMIEDDSSWIEWNRVHDFYDDHPYGNNHTWVSTLERLNAYIEGRRHLPLVLGEAIAADTWTTGNPYVDASPMKKSAHEPWSFAAGREWLAAKQQQAEWCGTEFSEQQLAQDSARYAMSMRKFQIETYRREVPHGGYVVSVIRDFPKAAMGLIDFAGQPKTSTDDWGFQGDPMILLDTPADCRSFEGGRKQEFRFVIAGSPGTALEPDAGLLWRLQARDGQEMARGTVRPGDMKTNPESGHVEGTAEIFVPVQTQPLAAIIRCEYKPGGETVSNEWPIWICPEPDFSNLDVAATRSFLSRFPENEFSGIREFSPGNRFPGVLITSSMDLDVLGFLESGGSVLMLPVKSDGSFKLEDHWFLRGAPALFREPASATAIASSEPADDMLVELQHFDLAGPVIPRIDSWIERIDPKMLLWDNHDLREFRTHGLLFSMPVGNSGNLMVSALNHAGQSNAAGKWLFGELLKTMLAEGTPDREKSGLGVANALLLRQNLLKKRIALADREWKFRPDRNNVGHEQGWQSGEASEDDWSPIRIGSHWEGQGHPDLDGWAWYRTSIRIPDDWPEQTGHLVFTGLDDYGEIYVNGTLMGTCGDLERRETAFDLASSMDVGKQIVPGQSMELVIAVNDWNGAGGLFRPIFLATEPGDRQPEILTPLLSGAGK